MRLYLICRTCLQSSGKTFDDSSLIIAERISVAVSWETPEILDKIKYSLVQDLDSFFRKHWHAMDRDLEQFELVSEDLIQPAARTR